MHLYSGTFPHTSLRAHPPPGTRRTISLDVTACGIPSSRLQPLSVLGPFKKNALQWQEDSVVFISSMAPPRTACRRVSRKPSHSNYSTTNRVTKTSRLRSKKAIKHAKGAARHKANKTSRQLAGLLDNLDLALNSHDYLDSDEDLDFEDVIS